jgi:hypothetical protein
MTKLEASKLTNKKILIHTMMPGLDNIYLPDLKTNPSQQDKKPGAHTQALQPRCQ